MSEIQVGMSFVGVLLLLTFLRVPIAVSLISVSFCGIWTLLGWKIAWGALGVIPFQFASSWLLSSVPTFVFMGFICYHGKLTEALFEVARVWLSRLPGGLAVASVLGCAGFAAVTGSSVACSAAMGRIAVPEMLKQKYSAELATGTVAASGTIGALIPPSILMIFYGIIAQVAITKLFIGGVLVGMLTALAYIGVVVLRVILNPSLAPRLDEHFTLGQKLTQLGEIWPVLVIAIVVFGGLFGGLLTPTEAGAVGALLSCIVALFKGTLTWEALRVSTAETLVTTSSLLIIAIGASLLARFLALSGVGIAIQSTIVGLDVSPLVIIIVILLVYLVLGMFLEPLGAMLLTLPVVLPIVTQYEFNLLWFGVFLTKLLEVGMVTPPLGMNVFVISSVVGKSATTSLVFRGVFWFFVTDIAILLLLIAFPSIVLWLPSLT